MRHLQERVGELKGERSELDARTPTLPATSCAGAYEASRVVVRTQAARPLMPGWAAVVLAVTIVASALFVIRRRRTPSFVVPDTIPDELLEREPAVPR